MRKKLSSFIGGILKKNVRTHASSTAFFFFMAMIPLLILLASLVPYYQSNAGEVIRFFQRFLPKDAWPFVSTVIREAFENSGTAFSLSLLLLLWTASRGVTALMEGLNAMYGETDTRGFGRRTLLSFVYTLALMAFLAAVIYLIFGGELNRMLKRVFPQIRLRTGSSTFMEFLLLLLIGIVFFSLAYCFLPSGKRSFRMQLPGAFLASSGWVIFAMGFYIYVSVFDSFARFYGSLATVILLLFWLYWIFFILLAGGYVNAHLYELLPARFIALLETRRRLGILVSVLFLAGFLSYLSDCYLNWRLYASFGLKVLLITLKAVTTFGWLSASLILRYALKEKPPMRHLILLLLLIAGDFALMRKELIPQVIVYLLVFTLWNAAMLYLCMQLVFAGERGREGIA